MVGRIVDIEEPKSYYDASKQPGWIEAMDKEIQSLIENEYREITSLLPGRKAIGCRWVYKTKYRADSTIERNKARLVIQGYNQKKGIEYTHTYAPVAKNVQNAFLHGHLKEDIYMHIPLRYSIMIMSALRDRGSLILQCANSIKLYMALNKPLDSGLQSFTLH